MPEAKTKPTSVSPEDYLTQIPDPTKRADCLELVKLMQRVTQQNPIMWGENIVGFGSYQYTYPSGHSGESCCIGFSSRKNNISVYLAASSAIQQALLSQLGKHKMGKACLSIKKLADINLEVLEELLYNAFAETNKRYKTS